MDRRLATGGNSWGPRIRLGSPSPLAAFAKLLWPLVTSFYACWLTAHHTQFYSPDWLYLRHGRGLGTLLGNGSYISLTSADRRHLTIVIQTLVVITFSVVDNDVVTIAFHKPTFLLTDIFSVWRWHTLLLMTLSLYDDNAVNTGRSPVGRRPVGLRA